MLCYCAVLCYVLQKDIFSQFLYSSDPVYLIDYPVTVIGHAGSAIVIECKFAGYLNPQPSLTKWYYNGAEITSSNRVTIDIVSESLDYYGYVNTSLLIDNAAVNDTGVYRCESENCAPDCFSREEGNISVTINRKWL